MKYEILVSKDNKVLGAAGGWLLGLERTWFFLRLTKMV